MNEGIETMQMHTARRKPVLFLAQQMVIYSLSSLVSVDGLNRE